MNLKDLLKYCEIDDVRGDVNVEIAKVCCDSRECSDGSLFVAVTGSNVDGNAFILSAIDNGAVAVISDAEFPPEGCSVPYITVPDARKALSRIADVFYGNPSSRMKVIGITGTNGKTSSVQFVAEIFRKAGKRVGTIGTLGAKFEEFFIDLERTTPEATELHRILDEMARRGAEYAVMEVSSHGTAMERVSDVIFRGGVFTNLTQDHLDYHDTMEDYYSAKKKFMDLPMDYAVVNTDSEYGRRIYVEAAQLASRKTGFGIHHPKEVSIDSVEYLPRSISFRLDARGRVYEFETNLAGEFSVYNVVGAILVAMEEGIRYEDIYEAVRNLDVVPGRMERVDAVPGSQVIIDYAHTPDGLENVLKALRKSAGGRLITVFGCGGDRDRAKRPLMGEVAGNLSDFCIVTSDNPRWEDPETIIDEIMPGIEKSAVSYDRITDRRDAIKRGLEILEEGDVLLIAGKGHETYQIVEGVRHSFDEKEIVHKILTEFRGKREN
jgi:UDP-N-acetylmuramoyl-L-alanyl-D-glutamate--2,6-diaminopimelate ligase